MFAIRCELLLGSYQAADPFGAADSPEWPPHPFRLHAALVAAACEAGGEQPAARAIDALRWLEAQPPPAITCDSTAGKRTAATVWVPRNTTPGSEASRYRKSGDVIVQVGRQLPTAVPAEATVLYTWDEADADLEALAGLAEGVAWLGSSRSPVACTVTTVAPKPSFEPHPAGRLQLRVASSGITQDLLESRFTHPSTAVAAIASYAKADGQPATDVTAVDAGGELLVRRVVDAPYSSGDTSLLTVALRAAVLARAGNDAPAALHGHDPTRQHAAYLALADVGHPNARGAVRGVALVLPPDVTPGERESCRRAFASVQPLALPPPHRAVRLEDDLEGLRTLDAERWTGPSRTWATATPVILDRYPRRSRTAEDELLASLANAGLPEPSSLTLLAGPAVAGGARTADLRGSLPPGMRVHARIEFDDPVRGPVLAGRGRFRGVGLSVPVSG